MTDNTDRPSDVADNLPRDATGKVIPFEPHCCPSCGAEVVRDGE